MRVPYAAQNNTHPGFYIFALQTHITGGVCCCVSHTVPSRIPSGGVLYLMLSGDEVQSHTCPCKGVVN